MVINSMGADLGMQAAGGMGMPKIGNAPDDATEAPHDPRENAIVRRASERAANASRPS